MDFTNCRMKERYARIETVPPAEYEDRLQRVRAYMREQGIDAIVDLAPGNNNVGLWLTGEYRATGFVVLGSGPVYVEFAQMEELADGTLVFPNGLPLEKCENPSQTFVNRLDCAALLGPAKKIGFLHIGDPNHGSPMVSRGLYRRLKPAIQGKQTPDVTYDINRIKSHRSELEVKLNQDTGKMLERILHAFPSICRRGRTYKDVCDEVQFLLASMGCPGDFMVCQIRPLDQYGRNITVLDADQAGVRVADSHMVTFLMETNGPSNHYACAARQYSFGPVSEEYQRKWKMCVEASRLCGRLLTPGANLADVTAVVIEYVRNSGYGIPDNRFVQSMGYSCAEDPRSHESAPLFEGTPIICHPPVYAKGERFVRGNGAKVLTMYVVSPGGGKLIYSYPEEIQAI